MSIILRNPLESDWEAILEAANTSAPWADNTEWFERRKAFAGFPRRHYVAEDTKTQRVIGYGGVEGEETEGKFRIFVVMNANLLATVGAQIYRQLETDLDDLKAKLVWAREESKDPLVDFFRRQGILEKHRFHHNELEIVVMEKILHNETLESEIH
jgi:hypothetical protein